MACIPASFLFAGLLYGGQTVQQTVGAPEIINIIGKHRVLFMALGGVIPMFADRLRSQAPRRLREEEAKLVAQVRGMRPTLLRRR